MKNIGTDSCGDVNSFSIKCNKCGKEAWMTPVHHSNDNLLKITLEFGCSCGNRYKTTIHDEKISLDDDLIYKFHLEDDSTIYVKIWFSSNPPADKNNPGCIGISVLDNDLNEIDGGELDYTDPNVKLKDMINDCIEFMDLKVNQEYFCSVPLRIHN